ncbi:hypothetical protein ACIODS_12470 [Micromonospora chalcea]|uniref:hypothetical protein n=1 Tax=Micromonospora chalcea TaxID=1874 RepID=UPI0037F16217
MERRARLNPMSAKKRAELAAAGNPTPYSTLTGGTGLARAGLARSSAALDRKPAKATGPDAATVALVIERDRGCCVRCGRHVAGGVRGRDFSIQHRRARGAGGTRRADTNMPQSLIVLCGSATTGCHDHVERNRVEARGFGWAVRQSDDPAVVPVRHAVHGLVLLAADGSFTPCRVVAS